MSDKEFIKTPIKLSNARRSLISQTPITIPPSPYLKRLGYGTGICVWKLDRSPKGNVPRSPWAVKKLRSGMISGQKENISSMLKCEANILKDLNHENIIGYRGLVKSKDGNECLAMETCGRGLGDLISDRYDQDAGPYPVNQILKVAYNVAKALKYLHEEKRIVHGDIKSHNVLIKGDFDEIKLCDFGVSKCINEEGLVEKYVGTCIYNAPECQDDADGPVTCKADIFSLGLVLWEMLALIPPHTDAEDSVVSEDTSLLSDEESFSIDEPMYGTRPPLPSVELGEEYNPVLELFYWCTEADPTKRPTADAIVKYLDDLETNKENKK